MKNLLFSLVLVATLVGGSAVAFAGTTESKGTEGSGNMNSEEITQLLKKGLDEPIVVQSGEESWVLHQPADHPRQFFPVASTEEMKVNQNEKGDRRES